MRECRHQNHGHHSQRALQREQKHTQAGAARTPGPQDKVAMNVLSQYGTHFPYLRTQRRATSRKAGEFAKHNVHFMHRCPFMCRFTGPVHRHRLRIQIGAARQVSGAGLGKENFIRFFACSSRADPLRCPGLDEILTTKCIRKNEEIHSQNGARGIFLISSFNLYASFALLGVVRFTQSTVSIGAA